jgi:hypothetical protein
LVSCARLLDSCGSAEEAVRCWRRAAKAGHLEGQLVYGLALYRGNAGLAQDAEDAYMWLLRALKQVGEAIRQGTQHLEAPLLGLVVQALCGAAPAVPWKDWCIIKHLLVGGQLGWVSTRLQM